MNIHRGLAGVFTLMVLWNFGRSLLQGKVLTVIIQYFLLGIIFSFALIFMDGRDKGKLKLSMRNLRLIVAWLPGAWIPKVNEWVNRDEN